MRTNISLPVYYITPLHQKNLLYTPRYVFIGASLRQVKQEFTELVI
jgi:hypothetical protein